MHKDDDQPKFLLTRKDGTPIEIPLGGSLELLAFGDLGIRAWRERRKPHQRKGNQPNLEPHE